MARRWRKPLLTMLAATAASVTMFPILWMLLISLKTQREALSLPPRLIFMPVFDAYASLWSRGGFAQGLANSAMVSLLTLAVCVFVGGLAAYAMSRFAFAGARTMLFAMLVTRIFPPVALITPYFLTLSGLGLQDTLTGLAIAYVAMNLPLAVWMLKGYFDAIPIEIEQCAMIDGATRWQAATRITLPLIAPGLAATSVFVFVGAWNEFLFALVLTSRLARTQIMAASAIALAPVLIATFILQRHIAQGLTAGAIKG